VGHAYGLESFEAAQAEQTEQALWGAVRTMDERHNLLRRMLRAADDIARQADVVRSVVEALYVPREPAATGEPVAAGDAGN
jgi:hypothetical protein